MTVGFQENGHVGHGGLWSRGVYDGKSRAEFLFFFHNLGGDNEVDQKKEADINERGDVEALFVVFGCLDLFAAGHGSVRLLKKFVLKDGDFTF